MKTKVTFSIDSDLLRDARVIAAAEGHSIGALLFTRRSTYWMSKAPGLAEDLLQQIRRQTKRSVQSAGPPYTPNVAHGAPNPSKRFLARLLRFPVPAAYMLACELHRARGRHDEAFCSQGTV